MLVTLEAMAETSDGPYSFIFQIGDDVTNVGERKGLL